MSTMTMTMTPSPVEDALTTARVRLQGELEVLARCEANGWQRDAATARREAQHYAEQIAGLESRLTTTR